MCPREPLHSVRRSHKLHVTFRLACQVCQVFSATSYSTPFGILEQVSLFPWYTRHIPCKPASRLHFLRTRDFAYSVRHGTSWNRHSHLALLGRLRTQTSAVIPNQSHRHVQPRNRRFIGLGVALEWHVRIAGSGRVSEHAPFWKFWGEVLLGWGGTPGAEPTTAGSGLPGKVAPGLNSQMVGHLRVDKTGSAAP